MLDQVPIAEPKILRTVRGYALEWPYRYHHGKFINQLDPNHQFSFLPGCFNKCLENNPDIALTQDLEGKPVFARTGDGTLQIESDDVGLLITAKLIDTPENRRLCNLIDAGKVRGWSHYAEVVFGGFRVKKEGDVRIDEHHTSRITQVTLVVKKFPRQKTRTTPIFLEGGPAGKVVAHV